MQWHHLLRMRPGQRNINHDHTFVRQGGGGGDSESSASDSDDDASSDEPEAVEPSGGTPKGILKNTTGAMKSGDTLDDDPSSSSASSTSSSASSDEAEEPAVTSASKPNAYPLTDIRRWMRPGSIWDYLDSCKPGEEDAGKSGGSADRAGKGEEGGKDHQGRALAYENEQRTMYEQLDDTAVERARKKAIKHPLFKDFVYDLVGDDKDLKKEFNEEFGTVEPVEELVAFDCFVWSKTEGEDQKKEAERKQQEKDARKLKEAEDDKKEAERKQQEEDARKLKEAEDQKRDAERKEQEEAERKQREEDERKQKEAEDQKKDAERKQREEDERKRNEAEDQKNDAPSEKKDKKKKKKDKKAKDKSAKKEKDKDDEKDPEGDGGTRKRSSEDSAGGQKEKKVRHEGEDKEKEGKRESEAEASGDSDSKKRKLEGAEEALKINSSTHRREYATWSRILENPSRLPAKLTAAVSNKDRTRVLGMTWYEIWMIRLRCQESRKQLFKDYVLSGEDLEQLVVRYENRLSEASRSEVRWGFRPRKWLEDRHGASKAAKIIQRKTDKGLTLAVRSLISSY